MDKAYACHFYLIPLEKLTSAACGVCPSAGPGDIPSQGEAWRTVPSSSLCFKFTKGSLQTNGHSAFQQGLQRASGSWAEMHLSTWANFLRQLLGKQMMLQKLFVLIHIKAYPQSGSILKPLSCMAAFVPKWNCCSVGILQ